MCVMLGMVSMARSLTVLCTVALVVWIEAWSAETVTVCTDVLTCNTTSSFTDCAVASDRLMALYLAKPESAFSTLTLYTPGSRYGTAKLPVASVTAVVAICVSWLTTVTAAPGTEAPELSVTLPTTEADLIWAKAAALSSRQKARTVATALKSRAGHASLLR